MTEISFEKIDSSGSGGEDAGYVMSVLMLIGGVLILFTVPGTGASIGGIGLIVIAVLGYIRLLRKTPTLRYFRYFWLDQYGVHHIEGKSPNNRTVHFAWHEIQSAGTGVRSDIKTRPQQSAGLRILAKAEFVSECQT